MNLYHIYLLCVFVIQFIFANGSSIGDTYDLIANNNDGWIPHGFPLAPPGYRYMPLSEVLANFDPKKYRITSYGSAMFGLDDDGLLRKKRGFFTSLSNQFKWNNEQQTDLSTTTDTTTEVDGDVKTVVTSTVTSTDGAVVATDKTVDESRRMTTMDGLKTRMMNIVDIGKDVQNSLVVSAPYLPVVFKVATYLVPGLSSYQVLVLSVNVATVTAQAIQDYRDGKEISKDAIGKLVMDTLLTKRDTGATVRQYAINIYDSIKNILSRFRSKKENTDSSSEKEILEEMSDIDTPEMKNNIKNPQTIVTTNIVNGVEIPEDESLVMENGSVIKRKLRHNKPITASSTEDSFGKSIVSKITKIKNKIKNSESMTSSGSDDSSKNTDESHDSDDSKDKSDEEFEEPIEVNQELFDKVLEQAMNLQPEEIKNKNDEELVSYIDNYQTHFSADVEFDTTNVFDFLINSMKFDENVTKKQKKKLVTMLSKVTNYFIDKNLENNK